MTIVTGQQVAVIRSVTGTTMYEFPPSEIVSLQWGRESQQVSKCTMATSPLLDSRGDFIDIIPWLHWLDVWSDDMNPVLYWSGPVQQPTTDAFGGQITAADVSVYLAKQRCPITESWDAIDPSVPALAAWQSMLTQKGLGYVTPIQRVNPWGQRFDVSLVMDIEMLDKTMQELEQMGLYWSVSAGVPLLGPMPLEPIASLGLNDFADKGVQVTRDGSTVFNDILVRGPDNIVRASIELNGLDLQNIVNINNMFELTNVMSAAQQYVLYTGSFRTTINVPSGAILVPDAPISIDQLVPTARYAVEVFGVRARMQLQSMTCTLSSGQTPQVGVTLIEVPNWTEIGKLLGSGGSLSMVSNAQAALGTGQAPTTSAVGQQVVVV